MNDQELKQEVLNLAHALGDADGLEYTTILYVSSELGLSLQQVQIILTEALFDFE